MNGKFIIGDLNVVPYMKGCIGSYPCITQGIA